jgi:hypothetical protein
LSQSLIKGFSKVGEINRATKFYLELKPLTKTYVLNIFLDALMKNGEKNFALEVFDFHLPLS